MRIARFSQGSSIHYGALEDESTRIVGLKGDPFFRRSNPLARSLNWMKCACFPR